MHEKPPQSAAQPDECQLLTRRDFVHNSVLTAASVGVLHPFALAARESPAIISGQKPRNIIFCVSDGMSAGVLTLAENYSLLTRGRGTQWLQMAACRETVHALMDTASADSLVTDSAAASSAWSCGERVQNGSLNITPEGKEKQPIGMAIHAKGRKFGLVTTATVTHATPAGFAVCQMNRADEAEIALKYLGAVDVVLGGGRAFFDPAKRNDRKDLFQTARDNGYTLCLNRRELLDATGAERLFGTFSDSHLPYVIDLPKTPGLEETIPSLAEMSRVAIQVLNRHPEGFLLQIEGARIDHAAHQNDIATLLREQLAFDDAVAVALEFAAASEDTLVIVTTDHGNSNPGLIGMGENYSQSTQAFFKVTAITESFDSIMQWGRQRAKTRDGLQSNELEARIFNSLKILPSEEELPLLLQALHDKPVEDLNRQLGSFYGILGQITGNHTGVEWIGNSHTADPAILHATGPGADEFRGWIRNDTVGRKLCALAGV